MHGADTLLRSLRSPKGIEPHHATQMGFAMSSDQRDLGHWTEPGSNRRPKDFQSFALPAELSVLVQPLYGMRRRPSTDPRVAHGFTDFQCKRLGKTAVSITRGDLVVSHRRRLAESSSIRNEASLLPVLGLLE